MRLGTEPSEHCFGDPCADIWVMDADRSDQTNLTPTEEPNNFHEYQPTWAPSGAQLAFVREIPGQILSKQPDIFVMDATGDNVTNLTNTDESEIEPAWSPDGTKIAFARVRESEWEIVTMDPDGQNETILSGDSFEGEDRAPDWSPDGTEITFTSNRAATEEEPFRTDIYVIAAPTTLPPLSETASFTTSEHSGVKGLAGSDVLLRTASAQTTSQTALRRLTTDGLSSDPDWANTADDTTPPKVMSTSPAKIAPTANVTATFSEAMDARTTDGDPSTKKAILNPSSNLSSGQTYRATVTTGAQDMAGNALDQNPNLANNQQKSWKFTVQ